MSDFSYAECRPLDEVLALSPKPVERRDRKKQCPQCGGRGWIRNVAIEGRDRTWPEPCRRCNGRACFRTMNLSRLLRVHRRDLYRVDTLTAGTKVGVRVLEAIAREFPEALS